jgi:hypothetical protein
MEPVITRSQSSAEWNDAISRTAAEVKTYSFMYQGQEGSGNLIATLQATETPELRELFKEVSAGVLPLDDGSQQYVSDNFDTLLRSHRNRWILVSKAQLVADADNPKELAQEAARRQIDNGLIIKIEEQSPTQLDAYMENVR